MGGDAFGQAAVLPGFAAGGLHSAGSQMPERAPGRKKPLASRPQDAVVGAQQLQQAGREHGVTILTAFAVSDADQLAFAIDIGGFQGDGFGDTQSGAIAKVSSTARFLTPETWSRKRWISSGASTTGSFSSRRARGKSCLSQGISRVTR